MGLRLPCLTVSWGSHIGSAFPEQEVAKGLNMTRVSCKKSVQS